MGVPRISAELERELRAASRTISKEKGEILFRAGTPARGAFLVKAGRVRLQLDGSPGIYPGRTLGAGSLIGLPATVSGEPYSLTAVVLQNCELGFVSRQKLLRLLRSNTLAAMNILQMLSEEIYQMRKAARRAEPGLRQ